MELTKQFTLDDLRKLNPCYDPTKYLKEDWKGTALDILAVNDCPPVDRISIVYKMLIIPREVWNSFLFWVVKDTQRFLNEDNDTLEGEILSATAFNVIAQATEFTKRLKSEPLVLCLKSHQYCYTLKYKRRAARIIGNWQLRALRNCLKN